MHFVSGTRTTELYKTAMVELEHAKIAGRVHDVRAAIVARVEKLETLPGLHSEEHQATDALNSLRVLDHEEAQYQAGQKQRAIDSALQRLKDIADNHCPRARTARSFCPCFLTEHLSPSSVKAPHPFRSLRPQAQLRGSLVVSRFQPLARPLFQP